jgi:predicted secreted protein
MADGTQNNWRELCVAVTNERDATKLNSLVQQLIEALDSGERSWRQTIPRSDATATNRESA